MNLKELSRELGLSQTTVSRALNGYPEVSEATRDRVQSAARTFNYIPNTRAKSLATGRAMAIGHVIATSDQHEMVNPVFSDFIAGAGETYAANGYEMVLSVVADGGEDAVYRSMKARGAVDGVIVHGPRMNDPRIAMLQDIGMPFAVHGRASGLTPNYSWLDVNNLRAFQRATDFLLDLGHRRIGLINGLEVMDFADRRKRGYIAALTGAGIAADPALMHSGEMTEGHGYRATIAMLDGPDPATAILTASLICALGVRRALHERGLVMGRDVSVLTHDDVMSYLGNGDDLPIFTCVKSSVREAGRILAQMLLDEIDGTTPGPAAHLLEAQLTVGTSTGPAPHP